MEATSELTTAAFIATLCRFISRRERPLTLCSDNGTNFVGANRELKEVYQFIGDMLVNENIEFSTHGSTMGSRGEIVQVLSQASYGQRSFHVRGIDNST